LGSGNLSVNESLQELPGTNFSEQKLTEEIILGNSSDANFSDSETNHLYINYSFQNYTEQAFPPFGIGENSSGQVVLNDPLMETNTSAPDLSDAIAISDENASLEDLEARNDSVTFYDFAVFSSVYNFLVSMAGPSLTLNELSLGVSRLGPIYNFAFGSNNLDDFELSLNTNQPFAVRIQFEIPKYEANQFNFSISEGDFFGAIDPEVSGCGALDSADSVYYLTRNIEAVGTCFIISANNVTLDCQGKRIRYSSTGSNAYAAYSIANYTTIKNCIITEGNINNNIGIGIYLADTHGSMILNNTFLLNDLFDSSIYLDFGTNQSILGNKFSTVSDIIYPLYSSGTRYALIANNSFDNPTSDSYAIFFGPGSSFNDIIGNNFSSLHYSAYSIYINSSDSNNILFNDFAIQGDTDYLLFIDSGVNFNISYNNFTNYASNAYSVYFYNVSNSEVSFNNLSTDSLENSYGVYLKNSYGNIINNNYFYSAGDLAYSVFLVSSTNSVLRSNNFQYTGSFGSALYEDNSDSTSVEGNNIVINATSAYGLYAQDSSFGVFELNNFTDFGTESYFCYLNSSLYNHFSGDTINTFGDQSYCFYFDTDTNGNNASRVNCNSSGVDSYSIYVSGLNNSFSFYDSIIDSGSSYELLAGEGANFGSFEFINSSLENYSLGTTNSSIYFYFYLEVLARLFNETVISGLNISVWNSSGLLFSGLTDDHGRIGPIKLLGYNLDSLGLLNHYSYNIFTLNDTVVIPLINLSSNNLTILTLNLTTDTPLVESLSPSGGGSSSSGGGAGLTGLAINDSGCTAVWYCEDWSDCIAGKQTRICTNLNPECDKNSPDTDRSCKTEGVKVNNKSALFDINLKILKKNLLNSEELSGVVGLINLGVPGKVKAHLFYQVRDASGANVYEERETVPVETQLEFIKTINISNFADGNYELSIDLNYEGQKEPAMAVDRFSVGEGVLFEIAGQRAILILAFLVIAFGIVILIIWGLRKLKRKKENFGSSLTNLPVQ
jgi:hypothetical protein